jgi:hypothetical protein
MAYPLAASKDLDAGRSSLVHRFSHNDNGARPLPPSP